MILINRRLAEQYWPGEDPIGKRLKVGPADSPNAWLTVVGVVGDVRQTGLYEQKLEFYVPYMQERRSFMAPARSRRAHEGRPGGDRGRGAAGRVDSRQGPAGLECTHHGSGVCGGDLAGTFSDVDARIVCGARARARVCRALRSDLLFGGATNA